VYLFRSSADKTCDSLLLLVQLLNQIAAMGSTTTASTESEEHSPSTLAALYDTRRRGRKDTYSSNAAQSVEEYLYELDLYRYTTMQPPLPLPLEKVKDNLAMQTLNATIEKDAEILRCLKSAMPGVDRFTYEVVCRRKRMAGNQPTDMLQQVFIIKTSLGREIFQIDWNQKARGVKSSLSGCKAFTDLGLIDCDVEILDKSQTWRPTMDTIKHEDDYAKVYRQVHGRLRTCLDEHLGQKWTDLNFLYLRQRTTGDLWGQGTIVVTVQPGTHHTWPNLRKKMLHCFFQGSFPARYTEMVNQIDVEFVPTYNKYLPHRRTVMAPKSNEGLTVQTPDGGRIQVDEYAVTDSSGDPSPPRPKAQSQTSSLEATQASPAKGNVKRTLAKPDKLHLSLGSRRRNISKEQPRPAFVSDVADQYVPLQPEAPLDRAGPLRVLNTGSREQSPHRPKAADVDGSGYANEFVYATTPGQSHGKVDFAGVHETSEANASAEHEPAAPADSGTPSSSQHSRGSVEPRRPSQTGISSGPNNNPATREATTSENRENMRPETVDNPTTATEISNNPEPHNSEPQQAESTHPTDPAEANPVPDYDTANGFGFPKHNNPFGDRPLQLIHAKDLPKPPESYAKRALNGIRRAVSKENIRRLFRSSELGDGEAAVKAREEKRLAREEGRR